MEIRNAEFIVVTDKPDAIIGFNEKNFNAKIAHKVSGLFSDADTLYVLEFPSGVRMDVFHSTKIKGEDYAVRINVDSLDETLPIYLGAGFTLDADPVENPGMKAALLKNPTGNFVVLLEHVKN